MEQEMIIGEMDLENSVCLECKFFGVVEVAKDQEQPVCRRFPPTVHTLMSFHKLDPHVPKMTVLNLFPSIPPDGLGCGEFVRKIEMGG